MILFFHFIEFSVFLRNTVTSASLGFVSQKVLFFLKRGYAILHVGPLPNVIEYNILCTSLL